MLLDHKEALGTWTSTRADIEGMASDLLIKELQKSVYGAADANFTGFNDTVLRVTALEYLPFSMKRTLSDGTIYYEGICANIVNILAEVLHFRVSWQEVYDGGFGGLDENKRWTGMIGEVHRGEADFAASGITITSLRDTAVDFTYPFWAESLGVMVKKMEDQSPLARIFQPLHYWVWLCLALCMLCATAAMWGMGRVIPSDPVGRTLASSWWYINISLLNQGSPSQPSHGAIRLVASSWLLVGFIIVVTYTGNLTAFLAIKQDRLPFSSLDDMVQQTEYKYGVEQNHVAQLIFQTTDSGIYADIHAGIESDPTNIARTATEGFVKVRQEKYAFISDETFLAINASDDCSLSLIDEKFYETGFGFAVPSGWPYKKYFDRIIVRLQEGGFIQRWTKQFMPKTKCSNQIAFQAKKFKLEDVYGTFVILGIGLGLSTLLLLCEFIVSRCASKSAQKMTSLKT